MRQRRWLELIEDYELEVHYHPGKANVVAEVLSQKDHCHCLRVSPKDSTLCDDFRRLGLQMVSEGYLSNLKVKSILINRIKEA